MDPYSTHSSGRFAFSKLGAEELLSTGSEEGKLGSQLLLHGQLLYENSQPNKHDQRAMVTAEALRNEGHLKNIEVICLH